MTEYSSGVEVPPLPPEEKKYREQFADFCDKLSLKFNGVKLPDTFKNQLLDETGYPAHGNRKYSEKAGTGYVVLKCETDSKKSFVSLSVYFYSNADDYNKYKN